jgi:hypothetical protein
MTLRTNHASPRAIAAIVTPVLIAAMARRLWHVQHGTTERPDE